VHHKLSWNSKGTFGGNVSCRIQNDISRSYESWFAQKSDKKFVNEIVLWKSLNEVDPLLPDVSEHFCYGDVLNKTYILIIYYSWLLGRGPSIKDVRTKSRKINPSPCLQNVHNGLTPLSVRTHHKFWKIYSFFATKSADARIWRLDNPLLLWLWTFFMDSSWLIRGLTQKSINFQISAPINYGFITHIQPFANHISASYKVHTTTGNVQISYDALLKPSEYRHMERGEVGQIII